MIHADYGDYSSAENYSTQARAARDRIERPEDQAVIDLELNLLCGQIRIGTGRLEEAEECLKRNLDLLSLQPKPPPDFFIQTLLELSKINAAHGRFDLARTQLRSATEVIENNDAYFAIAALRMSFENERRKLYEAAIEFEYNHDGKDAAWSYLRQYRSKLFLEFMRLMNPGIASIHSQVIRRGKIQTLIPSDLQVIEYVMLKDRLLIWLVSRDRFRSVEVEVSRADLEAKVGRFLERINNKGEVRPAAEELYTLLIEPIASQLDPKRTLAIIPDQALHRLNFPALYSATKKAFLIQEYTILESPNLATLLSGGGMPPSRGPAVAFGARTDNTGATRELRTLGQFYVGMQNFSGEAALKPAFLSSLGSASVFHYAGHSQDASDPLRSSVLLDGDREGPNSVTAVDISRRRMPPNSVVVLASCDSSVGNSRDGIGMRGLTSAFLISGAGSVVGSLWLVEAESTSRLVLQFHKGFATERRPVAEALRNAQLAFIQEGAHPYYWSGFVVTGNTSALR
jgi:CHAT domain-containing protein